MFTLRNKTILGVRLVAILEVLIFLAGLYVFDRIFGSGHRFISIDPHPLWIILLLILFQYSINEAILTIVLMTLFLYCWNLPVQQATQSIFEYYYSLSIRPILWLGMAILLGGLKLRSNSRLLESQNQLKAAKQKERVISDSFAKLKERNQMLEVRLSEELGSAIKIYKAAITLEDLAPDNQIDGINKIVAMILNPEKFSIFIKSEDGMTLSSNYAWSQTDIYAKKFDKNANLYKAVMGEKRILSVFNDASDFILNNEGILAGPLIDSNSGEVFGMLKIEKMTFSSFNTRNLQLFALLCEWIGLTLQKMKDFQQMASVAISGHNHRSYSYAFLQAQTEFLEALARRIGFHLTKLNVRIVNSDELSVEVRRHAAVSMSTGIKNSLRKTDLLFDARERGEEYALLLCGTGEEYIDLVIKKILNNVEKITGPDNPAKYSFSYQVLFHSDRNPTWQGGS